MNNPTYEQRLKKLIARLDAEHYEHPTTSVEVDEALKNSSLRNYLLSWVLPELQEIHDREVRTNARKRRNRLTELEVGVSP